MADNLFSFGALSLTHEWRLARLRQIAALFALALLIVLSSSPALAYKVYVSNEKGNSISVLDSDSMR